MSGSVTNSSASGSGLAVRERPGSTEQAVSSAVDEVVAPASVDHEDGRAQGIERRLRQRALKREVVEALLQTRHPLQVRCQPPEDSLAVGTEGSVVEVSLHAEPQAGMRLGALELAAADPADVARAGEVDHRPDATEGKPEDAGGGRSGPPATAAAGTACRRAAAAARIARNTLRTTPMKPLHAHRCANAACSVLRAGAGFVGGVHRSGLSRATRALPNTAAAAP